MAISAFKALIVIFFLITSGDIAHARDFTARKKVEGHMINIAINRNPPIVAKNELRIDIVNPLGKPVKNENVTINYYMPPMPGMAPMNYTIRANPKGDGYAMTMDLIMTGPWIIVIKFPFQGKRLQMSFPIDVR